MEKLQEALAVVVGGACTLLAGASVLYMGVFYTGGYDGVSINEKLSHHMSSLISSHPVLNNLLLLSIFFGSHSLLAREWVKKALYPVLSKSLYRQLYFLVSSLTLFLATFGWSPLPHGVWLVDSTALRLPLYGLQVCGAVLIVISFFSVSPLEFCGLQDPIDHLMGNRGKIKAGDGQLVVTGVYGLVRHPMYTGLLVFLWSQPTMTQGQFLLALATTLYFLLAVPCLEEPDLLEQFGVGYRHYMITTGMFFPNPFTSPKEK